MALYVIYVFVLNGPVHLPVTFSCNVVLFFRNSFIALCTEGACVCRDNFR